VASIFTRIIEGELPGHFVWRDDTCVAFLSISPLRTGHTLVVPIAEVDHWVDLEPEVASHLMTVSQTVGRAQMAAFAPVRVGLIVAGMEVPHAHLHVVPIDRESDLHFANAHAVPAEELQDASERLRAALADLGHTSSG
jgi:histidine triad (HIT) family protein